MAPPTNAAAPRPVVAPHRPHLAWLLPKPIKLLTRSTAVVDRYVQPATVPKLWEAPAPGKPGQWTDDSHDKTSDPINLYVHGTLADLEARFEKAGWTKADKPGFSSSLAFVGAAVVEELDPYSLAAKAKVQEMPVSAETLAGRPMLAAFERDTKVIGGRHHFRIFDTGTLDAQGRSVFAIAASQDIGIELDAHRPEQVFLNHRVAKDTDPERDFVLSALKESAVHVDTLPLHYGAPGVATGADSVDGVAYDVTLEPEGAKSFFPPLLICPVAD